MWVGLLPIKVIEAQPRSHSYDLLPTTQTHLARGYCIEPPFDSLATKLENLPDLIKKPSICFRGWSHTSSALRVGHWKHANLRALRAGQSDRCVAYYIVSSAFPHSVQVTESTRPILNRCPFKLQWPVVSTVTVENAVTVVTYSDRIPTLEGHSDLPLRPSWGICTASLENLQFCKLDQ